MKIGIIGSGNVGGTLGSRWARGGHEVVFGSRNPQSDDQKELARKAGPNAGTGTPKEAAAASDVIALATPWPATRDALQSLGNLAGKVLIDVTNPLLPDLSGLDYGGAGSSGAERVAGWAPGARVVKAFNTVGFNVMADAKFGAERPLMFYCGDDAAAKRIAHDLAVELDFEPADAGPLTQARVLEPFALLWVSLAIKYGYGADFAFKMLRR